MAGDGLLSVSLHQLEVSAPSFLYSNVSCHSLRLEGIRSLLTCSIRGGSWSRLADETSQWNPYRNLHRAHHRGRYITATVTTTVTAAPKVCTMPENGGNQPVAPVQSYYPMPVGYDGGHEGGAVPSSGESLFHPSLCID